MTRPRASKTRERHYTGQNNGVGIVLESCLMQLTFDNGQKFDGEVCIVKTTVGHRGLPYAVTCDGEIMCVDGFVAAFATIQDAAEFARL